MSFVTYLEKKGLLSKEAASTLAAERKNGETENLETRIRELGVSPTALLEAKGEYYHIPTRTITGDVSHDVLQYIPEKTARLYKIIPFEVADGVLHVGMVDPDDVEARDTIQFTTAKGNVPYKIFLITESDFNKALKGYSGLTGTVSEALDVLDTETHLEQTEKKATGEELEGETEGLVASSVKTAEDAPITKIVATLIRYAVEGNASDVHVEHMGTQVRVRFRVDGSLYTSLVLPKDVHQAVVARVKILSKLRLDERRKPQDGRFSAHIDGRKIDFRVSTFPAYYGEKVVLRILDSERGVIALDKLDMRPRELDLVKKAINAPYGMVLVSGPTGSGKTTTLYSMLAEVDRETQNVLSLEDPVEYNVAGMSQSQIRPEIGYTFANGLRTTLRQDPDIIMVGEIRDKETAELAIQAALTGHLVFSTIHTNTAIGAIPRLIDMGVDPYLIAPTLNLVIAQRLSKRLCPGAGTPIPVEDSVRMMIDKELEDIPEEFRSKIEFPENVFEASASKDCPSGTKGRIAVFEALNVTKQIERAILEEASEAEIMDIARQDGMITMREDALLKSFKRLIPFEEVNQV